MKRALIVKMWALGDILMATPLIDALRQAHPGIHITWVVDETHGDFLEGHPAINELVVLHSGQWRRLLRKANLPAWVKRTSEIRRDMAARKFDIVINCHPELWWTNFLCAAPVRVGLFPGKKTTWPRRFYTHVVQRQKGVHNTDHYLAATRAIGIPDGSKQMTIGETPEEKPFIRDFFAQHGLREDRPMVVLAPFAAVGENRNWEPERVAAVADWLQTEREAQVILTFAPRSKEKAQEITGLCKTNILCAEGTTLHQYIALIRRANLTFCMDSSSMHLAAAVGTPYIALFGPTAVKNVAPLVGRGLPIARPEGLWCAPCHNPSHCINPNFRACMKRIEVLDVQRAIDELLFPSSSPFPIATIQENKVP